MSDAKIIINRAPVFTLWAAVVAQRLGFGEDEALSLGKAVAGLNAQTKGRMLGIYQPGKTPHGGAPKKTGLGEEFWVELCGRPVPAKNTEAGVRAVARDVPIDADKARAYVQSKFGEALDAVRAAMAELAGSYPPESLADCAYELYERFRPEIPKGKRGWGAKGGLDLDVIRSLKAKSA